MCLNRQFHNLGRNTDNQVPRLLYVALLCICLRDAEAQGKSSVELGMRQINLAAGVQALEQLFIRGIVALEAKADEVQIRWRHDLEARILTHPLRELLRHGDMTPYHRLQSFDAIAADHAPQLQRPEAAAERNVPVTV